MNKNGPNKLPCGNPKSFMHSTENEDLTFVICLLICKYLSKHSRQLHIIIMISTIINNSKDISCVNIEINYLRKRHVINSRTHYSLIL